MVVHKPVSAQTVSAKTDAAMDRQTPSNGTVQAAVPKLEEEDVAMKDIAPVTNGIKRKPSHSRPDFAEAESSNDDEPLVRLSPHFAPSLWHLG